MKVRVQEGKQGFIYGSMRVRDDENKGRDIFTLKPVEHSVEKDSKGDPVIISVEQQFSKIWMEKVGGQDKPEEPEGPQKPADMKVPELKAALEEAGVDVPAEALKSDLVKLLEDHISSE